MERGGRLVGVGGFEPPTSRSRTERSTKLSHTPTRRGSIPSGPAACSGAIVALPSRAQTSGRAVRPAGPDSAADRFDTALQAPAAHLGGLVDAGLVGIDLIAHAILGRGQVRHHDVGAAHEAQLPALRLVDRRERRGTRDVRVGADESREGDDLVGRQLVARDLLRRAGIVRTQLSSPRGVSGCEI